MILMMVFNLIHALVLLEAAWYLHTVTLAEWEAKSEAPLEMINVPEALFWSADTALNAEIMSHEFQKPKGYKPRFYTSAKQCLQGNEPTRCPEDAIEGHADDLQSWHQSYIKYHTVDEIECPESIYIDPSELTQEFRQDESCGTVDQLVEKMRTVVRLNYLPLARLLFVGQHAADCCRLHRPSHTVEHRLSTARRSMMEIKFVANQAGVWNGACAPFRVHCWACVKVLAPGIKTVKLVLSACRLMMSMNN